MHVIYRRINDDYLDPTVFRPESVLGIPGVFGLLALANVAAAGALFTLEPAYAQRCRAWLGRSGNKPA